MTIELIHSTTDFLQLKENWNALLTQSASHVPFLRHEFLSHWWTNLGGGEWDSGELAILLQRDGDQMLTGIAPFFISNQKIRFIGSYEIADYLDLIAAPDNLSGFISEIIDYLSSDLAPDWKTVDLYNLPEHSPTIGLMEDAARSAGFQTSVDILQPAPAVQLPSSWRAYLDSLEDRYRQEISRKIRNADSYFLPVDWYIVDENHDLDQELEAFFDLMANNLEKEKFLTDQMKTQIKDSARAAFDEGWLQLVFLVVGDIKAAGYMNFDFDEKIWIYNSGINTVFENLSPGWVLLGKIINWSIEQGKTELDFMRGDETYKYQFGGIDQNVIHLQISR
jgi:CelD/BcsL family acetyltransferase involved in cellulose biosynthesis